MNRLFCCFSKRANLLAEKETPTTKNNIEARLRTAAVSESGPNAAGQEQTRKAAPP